MRTFLLILQVVSAIALIAVVLLQSGRSAGLSGSITGGSEAIFGKKKGLNEFLSKMTAYIGGLFIVLSLVQAVLK